MKKLESETAESSTLSRNPVSVDDQAAVLCFVEDPNVFLAVNTRKPRTGRGKKQNVDDSSQSRLSFNQTEVTKHFAEGSEKNSEPERKQVTTLGAAQVNMNNQDFKNFDKLSQPTDASEELKHELGKTFLPEKESETGEKNENPGHVKPLKLKVIMQSSEKRVSEATKNDDIPELCQLEATTHNDPTFKPVENLRRQSQTASTNRSQRMLLSVNQSDLNLQSKSDHVIRPDKSIKTRVEPGKSFPMQRNVENKLLVSPVKRKQLLATEQDDSNSSVEAPSSPRKIVKKDLFVKSDAASKEQQSKTELYLPVKYQMLVDQFVALETTAQILFNRKEQIQFEKIVSAVQTTTRRNFTLTDLAKIFQVEPDFYQASYEKKFNCAITKTFSWVLCLYPILDEEKNVISAADLIARRRQFYDKLIDIVHEHHFNFLHNLNPNLSIAKAKILRWHPKFQIERLPGIEPLELPEKPILSKPRQGLNELILKSKEKATEKLDRALAKIEASSLSPSSSPKALSPAPKTTSTKEPRQLKYGANSNLGGISEKLKLKIMAKEAVNAQEKLEMSCDQKMMNEKLPNVAKVLRVTFLSDKRCAIPQDEIMSKCGSSVKGGVSREQTERALKLIMDCVPQWLSIVVVQSRHYIKVNKSVDFNLILKKIQEKFPI